MIKRLILAVVLLFVYLNLQSQGTQLLRQPTISAEHIVFVYANDLWKVDRTGGNAIRLTSNEGYESLPHFSPDEQWIAFTGEYGGNTDVYLIPATGGEPKRLTWHPAGDYVQGWTPDGKIMFRSGRKGHPTQTNKFYIISKEGGLPAELPIPRAAYGELSPDGNHLAYVPITSWDPEWRNYRGGQAMPIWIVSMDSKELIRTPQPDKERHLDPVWFNNQVFYLSERDYAANIWSFDPVTKTEKQITFHKKFDVKSLDAGADALVYEQGGYLHLLDPASGNSQQLEIHVSGDMNFARERWEKITASNLQHPNISPNGKRAIFEYRGEIFSFPKDKGSWRNLTNSPGVADRSPVWSPQGDKVAWFSDAGGEYQLQIGDQMGQQIKTLALPNPTFYFRPDWSPDGQRIAYTDTDYNLWTIDLESGTSQKVDTDRYAHPDRAMNPIWSPDGKWIAYSRQLDNHFKAVFAYHIESKERLQLTDGMADAITPVWDQNGKYLYFLASTDYGLNTGWLDMSSYDPRINRSLYCLVLAQGSDSPTLPQSDEETAEQEDAANDKQAKEDQHKKEIPSIRIDREGLAQRIVALQLPSRNYEGLVTGPENTIFVLERIPNEEGLTLHRYDVKKLKAEEFLKGLSAAVSSYDGGHLLYKKANSWFLVESKTKPNGKEEEAKLSTEAQVKVDPQAEYHQIFKEGWRFMRDFLYVSNVHGAPWNDVYEWYAPWIDHVRHRTDLNYIVDIMSGEVAIGHSYVGGGDMPDIDRVPVGLLGCEFMLDGEFYRIEKIYSGESWNPSTKAPLHNPGLEVKEGDYLLAVNGQPLRAPVNPYSLFEQTSGRATTLHVNSTPSLTGARQVIVEPVPSEFQLRRWNWVENNRKKVEELSDGKLAYVYLPNTGGSGFEYFNRYYFAQQDKKGVIIDERNNGGGSAADYMVDIMARTLFGYFNSPVNDNRPWTTPMAGIWGPKVMIINERAGSGGDLLPYMFKAKNIGPLVGTRTWGGLVGTWDTPSFIDGGRMVAPRGGFFDVDGRWAVEGEGIAPDIEVIQEPRLVMQGKDPQLERAVEEALKLMEMTNFKLKPEPAAPIRWKRPEGFNNQ